MPVVEVDIYSAFGEMVVCIRRPRKVYGYRSLVSQWDNVSRSSLIRAQRMQLLAYDKMKGQSPDGTEAGTLTANEG